MEERHVFIDEFIKEVGVEGQESNGRGGVGNERVDSRVDQLISLCVIK